MADYPEQDPAEEVPSTQGGDVEMGDNENNGVDGGEEEGPNGNAIEGAELPFADTTLASPRTSFATYLASPIVTMIIGGGDAQQTLTAHESLLVQSPFFRTRCADLGHARQIELPHENIDAVGCFLEYLYTGEYFPKKLPGQRTLETDPSLPAVDESGDQLLKHARVYTLAEKWGVDSLKTLASSKIHCVDSTAKGEIAYARYVYAETTPEDSAIRAPIANFWATRSHTLRSEAEAEFRGLCLEYPQFGYDVLTRVLDEKLKRERNEKMHPSTSTGSARKRARHSNV